jgi:hypothetical protein
MKTAILSSLVLCAASALADAPLAPPTAWKTCTTSVNFCAHMDPQGDATVYKIDPPFNAKEVYKIAGWHRWVKLSDDGQFFISAYNGLNLVPLNVKPSQVMVTIWKNGAKHHEITLGQVIKNWSALRPTASHYYWGEVSQLSKDTLQLKTVEGLVSIHLETGVVSH